MELYLDGRKCACDHEPGATLDDVLDSVRKNNVESNRAILGLVCDGIDVVGDEVLSMLGAHADDYKRIDVETGAPNELIAHALEGAAEMLRSAETKRADVVTMLQEGKTGDAIILLGECLGHWQQINEAIAKSVSLLSAVGMSIEEELEKLSNALEPVTEKLNDIKDSLKSQDYVALSDILEYELDHVTASWQAVIDTILATGGVSQPQRVAS